MRKTIKILLSVMLMAVMSLSFIGCSEMGGASKTATAMGKGHGKAAYEKSIIEVSIVIGSDGMPKSVYFDEFFPIYYAGEAKVVDGNPVNVTATTEKVGAKTYYNVLYIGGEFFELTTNDDGIVTYKSTRGSLGTTNDLTLYTSGDGAQWYYDNLINKKCFYGKKIVDGSTIIFEATSSPFTTIYGSIRKRQSTYWNGLAPDGIGQFSGLGWRGNMDALERYLITYGFDEVAKDGSIKNPSKDGSPYVQIGDVVTGATLASDAHLYLSVAKAAFDKARAM